MCYNEIIQKQDKNKFMKKVNSNGNMPADAKFVNPQDVINQLEVFEGAAVADFGCGTGYYVFPIAQKVGETGIVHALDVLESKLEAIKSQAKILGLTNIIASRVNLEKEGGSKLENNSVDWVILSNMLFQNKNKEVVIKEAARVAKPGGKILIIEWKKEGHSFGLEEDLKISKEEVMELAKKNSLNFSKEIAVSDFHYGLIFSK